MNKKKMISTFLMAFMIGVSIAPTYAATDRVNNLLNKWDNALQKIEKKEFYEVGDVKITYNSANPGTTYGGSWTLTGQGRVLIGAGNRYNQDSQGGNKTVTLSSSKIPSHSHSGTTSSVGNHGHYIDGLNDVSENTGYLFTNSSSNARGFAKTAKGHNLLLHSVGYNGTYGITGPAGNHNHTFSTSYNGGNAAHNNLQPYTTCYFWKKTANSSKTTNTIPNGTTQQKLENLEKRLKALDNKQKYQIGDVIYTDESNYYPGKRYGGTWVRTAESRVLVGVKTSDSSFQKVGLMGGEARHTLTLSEIASHNHSGTTSSTGSHQHSISQSWLWSVTSSSNNKMIEATNENTPGDYTNTRYLSIRAGESTNHTHSFSTSYTGDGQSHNNLMPYYTVNMWRKISDEDFNIYGSMYYNDNEFNRGYNGIEPYHVDAISLVDADPSCPVGNKMLKITKNNTSDSFPGAGGFIQTNKSIKANEDYYYVLIAKIPKGYSLYMAYNHLLGGNYSWITSNGGTGEWETYIFKINTGNDYTPVGDGCTSGGGWCHTPGSYDFGYFFLLGPSGQSITWHVAYSNLFMPQDVDVD